ncbi:multidrug and toxin extrusion protein 1-like [Balaenoptera ricei]|uniref:multidrug and toxin extrusion protein 1-like n=1 Tax=Balaenoptera ricei TaxID=2746895 RepID=UPI0028BE11A7|nr:multidrug and toxin extrusion protein 1-like [Balaenoptera ricei]
MAMVHVHIQALPAWSFGFRCLWLGIIICAVSQAVCFLGFIARLNWKKACQQAQVHGNLKRNVAQDRTVALSQDPLCPGPENHGGMWIREVEKTEEIQSDQQTCQVECLEVHPRATWKLSGRQRALQRGLLLFGVTVILLVGVLVRVYVRIQ